MLRDSGDLWWKFAAGRNVAPPILQSGNHARDGVVEGRTPLQIWLPVAVKEAEIIFPTALVQSFALRVRRVLRILRIPAVSFPCSDAARVARLRAILSRTVFRRIGLLFHHRLDYFSRRVKNQRMPQIPDRKSTRLNSSHLGISYAV